MDSVLQGVRVAVTLPDVTGASAFVLRQSISPAWLSTKAVPKLFSSFRQIFIERGGGGGDGNRSYSLQGLHEKTLTAPTLVNVPPPLLGPHFRLQKSLVGSRDY
jgi:hypothetical protein